MPYTLGIYIPHTHTIHIYIYIPHTTYHIHIYIPHTKVYSIGPTWSWPVMIPRLVLPVIDYSSQLWAPQEGVLLSKLEGLQKSFTKRVEGLRVMNYWERLKCLNLQSLHRRYTWKIMQYIVPNCGLMWDSNSR